MREILFRGKRITDGEWVVDGNIFIPDSNDHPTQICMGNDVMRITYDVDPATVGQYTGLTDKNGKKIFEGDIIAFITDDGDKSLYVVCWNKTKWVAKWLELTRLGSDIYNDMDYWNPNRWAVIGNIYDNPELLEKA